MKLMNSLKTVVKQLGLTQSQRRRRVFRNVLFEAMEARRLLATIDLATLTPAQGAVFYGAAMADLSGRSVSDAGDVNGDGFDDMIISSHESDIQGAGAGASHLIYGGPAIAEPQSDVILLDDMANPDYIIFHFNSAPAFNPDDDSRALLATVSDGGNPGSMLQVENIHDVLRDGNNAPLNGNGSTFLQTVVTKQSFAYTPSISGAFEEISFSIDIRFPESGGAASFQQIFFSITDPNLGLPIGFTNITGQAGWQTIQVTGLTNLDFPDHDFAGNLPLSFGFGFTSAGDVSGGSESLLMEVDNFQVSIERRSTLTAGTTFYGQGINDFAGRAVSGAGDLNGDGFDDLVIGAPFADGPENARTSGGESYVIFGSASLPSTVGIASVASVTILGADSQDQSGLSVSRAGDVNGDGYDDLILSAPLADGAGNAKANAGESYVIFGGATLPPVIDLAALGSAGFIVYGADTGDQSGLSVSGAGDVNGDGYDDVVIGTRSAVGLGRDANGVSYLIYGASSHPPSIDLAVSSGAFVTIVGAVNGDSAGYSVSDAGDVNGDGLDDLLIGAPGGNGAGNAKNNAGNYFVVFGSTSLPTTIDLAALGSAGITILGAETGDAGLDVNSGGSVSGAGDVNGDGYDDLMIGAERADAAGNLKSSAGDTYIIFGGPSLPTTIDLATPGNAGITLFGADVNDNSGVSVSNAGDVNGDGFGDLLIGAWLSDGLGNGATNAGESYLIFGGNGFTASATHLGTNAAETLTGTPAANIMVGGRAADVLLGRGGADVLIGAQGDDSIVISNVAFRRIHGGTGDDSLRLDGSGLVLNFTNLPDNRIQGIEQIDITGTGVNTLTLNYREVLNISDESNRLVVRRNGGDVVNIGTGWTQGPDQTIGLDKFQVFTQGIATLLIEDTTPQGTAGDDAFVLTYLSALNTGNVRITVATGGGPLTDLGVFPMNTPLTLDGMGGTDSVRIVGTSGSDNFIVNGIGITTNGHALTLANMESQRLVGAAGNDTYHFDADSALGLYTLDESLGGIDTIDMTPTALPIALNLNLATTQIVNANLSLILGSASRFENATGGSGNDTLTGNILNNVLNGGNGNDTINGGRGNDTINGGLGNDTYLFSAATTIESDVVNESPNAGTDVLSFAELAVPVTLNLGSIAVQSVHTNRKLKLNSASTFENVIGGSGNDVLTGNTLNNALNGGSGNDSLNGGAGNDNLTGGPGDDTYLFGLANTSEADQLNELSGGGSDWLNFAAIPTAVTLSLSSVAVQSVHANRTLKLNSAATFENVVGGASDDILTGNSVDNLLVGGGGNDVLVGAAGNDQLLGEAGRDILIGGMGLDTLNGGSDDDILIAGRTTSDTVNSRLNDIRAEWVSANNYGTRVANLRTGVGPSNASLQATINVLNDAGEDDLLTGGGGTDWFFQSFDDILADLQIDEIVDLLDLGIT